MDSDYDDPILVKDWLWLWHARKVKRDLKLTTQERYQGIIEHQLIPHVGDVRLADLSPRQVDEMHNALLELGLAPRTVRNVHTVLSGAYKEAVRLELVQRNPVAAVAPPSKPTNRVVPPDQNTVRELLRLTQAEEHYLFPFLRLLVFTGMRRGEALALRWGNVNLTERYLTVLAAAVKTRSQGTVITAPKSSTAFRPIDLDDGTVAVLREHRSAQAGVGRATDAGDLVFQGRDGHLMKTTNILRDLKALAERVGYPSLTFHSLRHFHATIALQQKQNPTVVSARLGHSSVNTTLAAYAHCMPGWQRGTADAFAQAMDADC